MKKNVVKKICEWLRAFGGSPFRFNRKMFNNYKYWQELDFLDLKEILEETKYCSICQYALVPFFVKYAGIDIRTLYLEMASSNNWDSIIVKKNIEIFPEEITTIHSSTIEDQPDYFLMKEYCKPMRERFLKKGLKDINKLKILNKDEWVFFTPTGATSVKQEEE